jgi:hypothetical protein
VVKKDGGEWRVNITSTINGLSPTTELNKSVYQNLAQVFRKMLPMLEELGGLSLETGEAQLR